MHIMKRSRNAFTLIELMAVVAIIGVVMALVLPALMRAPEAARLERARTEVANLDMVLQAYQTEYRTWPLGQSGGEFNTSLLQVLIGRSTNAARTHNPSRRVFLEIGALSTNAVGTLVDPWGQPYQYEVDDDYDNEITAGGDTVQGRRTAVWSMGPENTDATMIRSW
jgi:prepilin-type N-terminal cleavage/methylation domain-containing protein